MSDFGIFDLTITRFELGLPDLDLNDKLSYDTGAEIFGGQQTWNRQTVKSPFVDGEFLVHRSMANRQENLQIQVLGADQAELQANVQALLDAARQFNFLITLTMDNAAPRVWSCQTADFTVDWSNTRWLALKALVTLTIPTLPGVFGA